jgi:hypothetical protein
MGKRKIKISVIAFFILLVGVIILRMNGWFHYNDIRYKIYFSHRERPALNYLFGKLPSNYNQHFKEETIKESKSYALVNVVDLKIPFYSNDIFLKKKSTGQEEILKGYPLSIFKSNNEGDFETGSVYTNQIDIEVFNQYINNLNNVSREEVIEIFCFLLSVPGDSSSYMILKERAEVDSLNEVSTSNQKEYFESRGYKIIGRSDIRLDFSSDTVYCWFFDKGLVKLKFIFEKGTNNLIDVKPERLGIFGHERLSCC